MVEERRQRWCLFGAADCKQWGNIVYDVTSLLSGQRKDHEGQTTVTCKRDKRVIFARSGLPAEVFVTFNIVVFMIVAGLHTTLFSALKLLLSTKKFLVAPVNIHHETPLMH